MKFIGAFGQDNLDPNSAFNSTNTIVDAPVPLRHLCSLLMHEDNISAQPPCVLVSGRLTILVPIIPLGD